MANGTLITRRDIRESINHPQPRLMQVHRDRAVEPGNRQGPGNNSLTDTGTTINHRHHPGRVGLGRAAVSSNARGDRGDRLNQTAGHLEPVNERTNERVSPDTIFPAQRRSSLGSSRKSLFGEKQCEIRTRLMYLQLLVSECWEIKITSNDICDFKNESMIQ
jgi:hypothetical protein